MTTETKEPKITLERVPTDKLGTIISVSADGNPVGRIRQIGKNHPDIRIEWLTWEGTKATEHAIQAPMVGLADVTKEDIEHIAHKYLLPKTVNYPKPLTNKYYIQSYGNWGTPEANKPHFEEVKGKRVIIPGYEDLDMFVSGETGNWGVTEASTGLSMGQHGDTIKEAIEKAKKAIDYDGRVAFDKQIAETEKTPRYKETWRNLGADVPDIGSKEKPVLLPTGLPGYRKDGFWYYQGYSMQGTGEREWGRTVDPKYQNQYDNEWKPMPDMHHEPKPENKGNMSDGDKRLLESAYRDWIDNKAYIDNNGNYRLKVEGKPIAPWNKLVKEKYGKDSSQQLHNDAQPFKGTMSKLRLAESKERERDRLARNQDENRTNKVTISHTDKRFNAWLRDPGSSDVIGIDTPTRQYHSLSGKKKSHKINKRTDLTKLKRMHK